MQGLLKPCYTETPPTSAIEKKIPGMFVHNGMVGCVVVVALRFFGGGAIQARHGSMTGGLNLTTHMLQQQRALSARNKRYRYLVPKKSGLRHLSL
jgi:hypothetical protein